MPKKFRNLFGKLNWLFSSNSLIEFIPSETGIFSNIPNASREKMK